MVMSYPGRPPMVPGIPTMPPTMAMPYMQLGGELLVKQCENSCKYSYGINVIHKGFSLEVFNQNFRLLSFAFTISLNCTSFEDNFQFCVKYCSTWQL